LLETASTKSCNLAGWVIQDKKKLDFSAAEGIAVKEYQTEVGPADYVLFVDRTPVGVIEARKRKKDKTLQLWKISRVLMQLVN
jgi:type I restriction enzyme R subunit